MMGMRMSFQLLGRAEPAYKFFVFLTWAEHLGIQTQTELKSKETEPSNWFIRNFRHSPVMLTSCPHYHQDYRTLTHRRAIVGAAISHFLTCQSRLYSGEEMKETCNDFQGNISIFLLLPLETLTWNINLSLLLTKADGSVVYFQHFRYWFQIAVFFY